MSSNTGTVYWMDIFSHLFGVKLLCSLENTKINEKDAGIGPLFLKKIVHILICAKISQHVLDYLSPDDTKKTRKNLLIFLPSFCHFLLLLSSGFVSTYFTHLWTVSCSYPQGFDNHKNKTFSYKNCKECYYKMV